MKKRTRKKVRKVKRPNPQRPDLKFGTGDVGGFTASGIAGFHDLNPATVVRELLQNSLDAARDAGRDIAIIRFEVEERDIDSIPGIESYQAAFAQAKKDQEQIRRGQLQDTATGIVRTMEECLKSGGCETLFVLDNGIGLDKSRMENLLHDGVSSKMDTATGSVGNGHMTVIPASALRYVLYGGRTEKGEIIGSGHAVLASHEQDDECKSKDGFYVKDIKSQLFDRYEFPRDDEVPSYIKAKLEWIAANWEPGAGTVVAVPGFNYFRMEEESLWDMVSKAAACSFFAAFAKGELRVELRENDDEKFLDKSNIASTLERFSEEKRARKGFRGFLNGSRAFAAFKTIEQGKDLSIDTGIGPISMRWRELSQGGPSRVDLCRNDMWITDDLQRLKNQFADFKPFHCVILLDANDGEIHRLVRKAESPLHNHLEVKNLPKEEKAALDKAMKAISSKLKEVVPKHDTEEFEIEDVMAIDSSGFASGGRRPGMVGRFGKVRRRPRFPKETGEEEEREVGPGTDGAPESEGKGGGVNRNRRGRGTFRRSGSAIQFGAIAAPVGKRSLRVDLRPGEKAAGSEARFALDESLDESCDAFGSEEFVELKNVKIDGSPASEAMLTYDEEGRALGVRLGALDPEKAIQIEFDYEPPANFHLSDDMPVVLNTQLIRRKAASGNQESS